jgi:peptidoglycan/LPS O-acetylase OafA/YrhL
MNEPLARSTSVSAGTRDDHVLLTTRVAAAGVVFILALAVLALYLFPDFTDQNFAWTIKPRMMAMAIGAGYLMGAYFFARVLTSSRWHYVAGGFLPITSFTIGMALATILHWDRFHQNDYHALLWAIVYAITPFLVPFIWWRNQRADPQVPEANDLIVPQMVRMAALVVGIVITLVGVLVFLQPQLAINVWPWTLTPLTARVLAGWMMLPAVGGFYLMRESRWSGWRVLLETATVGALFFLIAMIVAWSDWSQTNPLTWVIALIIVGALLGAPTLVLVAERRRRTLSART